jgi:predicted Fe-Mo cluster-binding NifX family protein
MKIAASAAGPSLEDPVDPRFGRCSCFLIIDTETLQFEAIENSARNLSGGAGIEAAQRVADKGVTHVLTGRCGPNAERVLSTAGICIVDGCAGTVREAVERFRAESVSPEQRPAAGGTAVADSLSPLPSRPAVASPSGGFAGRGSGRGMGRGMGGGGGRGMGRRCGIGPAAGSFSMPIQPAAAPGDDIGRLTREAERLRQQLRETEQRLRQLEGQDPGRRSG